MSILDIVKWPDDRLATECAPVGQITPSVRDLACDMLETMYAAPGRGLAAPQVGELVRMFVMDTTWKDGAKTPTVFVDPVLVWECDERSVNSEGCLSIPGVTVDVERAARIKVQWTDLDGAKHEAELDGFEAICAQHELDHLDGRVTFDRLDDQTRENVLRQYSEVTV